MDNEIKTMKKGSKKSVSGDNVNEFRSICEVHREIHDILLDEKSLDVNVSNKMISLLEEAYRMAKKMNNKLRQYKHDYDDGWWEKSKEEVIKEKLERRKKNK